MKQICVQFLKIFFILVDLSKERVKGIFKSLLFFGNHFSEELLFKTLLCDREIDNGGLGGKFWRETGVGKSASHKEFEVAVVFYGLSSDIYEFCFTLYDDLFLEHWVEHGVDFIFYVLDNQAHSFFHAIFQEIILKFRMRNGSYRSCRVDELSEFVLYPNTSLRLGVDEHWVPSGVGYHDTVLDRQVIFWKSLEVPFSDSSVIYQEICEVETGGNWDVSFLHISDKEVLSEQASVISVEGSAVGNKGSSQGTVSD